jgi:hypothetical protein
MILAVLAVTNVLMWHRSPHYGSEFRVELVDATTDTTVGTSLLTTQGLLQEQRDFLIEDRGVRPWAYFREVRNFNTRRLLCLGLRFDMKTSSSLHYFLPSKSVPQKSTPRKGNVSNVAEDEKKNPSLTLLCFLGDIVAVAEILVGLHEDFNSVYGRPAYQCPSRPPDELDMSLFQRHLTRISDLIDDAKVLVESFQFMISWQNRSFVSRFPAVL